jgi:hypothetical protein
LAQKVTFSPSSVTLSETEEQKEIVDWFREAYPQYAMCLRVSQFGNHRGNSRKAAAIRTAKAKSQGAVKGEADIAILLPREARHGKIFGCLLIEHKSASGSHPISPEQQDYMDFHNDEDIGNVAISTRGIDMAIAAILAYIQETPRIPPPYKVPTDMP